MTQHDKPKRWRPRFSVKTLVIGVTLLCCYAACWQATNISGRLDIARLTIYGQAVGADYIIRKISRDDVTVCLPLVISVYGPYDENEPLFSPSVESRHYYFWFFGFVAKLPYEHDVEPRPFDWGADPLCPT